MIQFDKYFSNGLKPPTSLGDDSVSRRWRWLHDKENIPNKSVKRKGNPLKDIFKNAQKEVCSMNHDY